MTIHRRRVVRVPFPTCTDHPVPVTRGGSRTQDRCGVHCRPRCSVTRTRGPTCSNSSTSRRVALSGTS